MNLRVPRNNNRSKSFTQEQEREYAEQSFRNMIWFYRKILSKIQTGKALNQLGLSHGEIGNLRRQEILSLSYTGKYSNGNGRIYILTEKAKLILKEMAVSEN